MLNEIDIAFGRSVMGELDVRVRSEYDIDLKTFVVETINGWK